MVLAVRGGPFAARWVCVCPLILCMHPGPCDVTPGTRTVADSRSDAAAASATAAMGLSVSRSAWAWQAREREGLRSNVGRGLVLCAPGARSWPGLNRSPWQSNRLLACIE